MPKRSYNRILDEHLHILISQGNHEAFERLEKRYQRHNLRLCRELYSQYKKTGITLREITSVCNSCFLAAVKKYDPQLNSFYSFWRDNAIHSVMNYLVENAYVANYEEFKSLVSLDDQASERMSFGDVLCEKDDDPLKRKMILDIKIFVEKNRASYTGAEYTLLKLVLDGYSLADLEHSGAMSKSTLYLTFKSAVEKLKRLIERAKGNTP